jgi:rsbT co-antagonist protein RsbR
MNETVSLSQSTLDGGISHSLELFEIDDQVLEDVQAVGKIVLANGEQFLNEFYDWLETQPEFEQFFSDPEVLDRTKKSQFKFWEDFFRGAPDDEYLEQREELGKTHARIGLPLNTYFSGVSKFVRTINRLLDEHKMKDDLRLRYVRSVDRYMRLEISIIVGTYTRIEKETIAAQGRALMEMSTPVTEIWSDVLLLPLVGIIDSKRAQDVMDTTLKKISDTHARIFILDISGVGVVDTAVANHLIKITKATRLMGCESTISGVSPAIAQTIVELGIDVGTVKTTVTMKDALGDAFAVLGTRITEGR